MTVSTELKANMDKVKEIFAGCGDLVEGVLVPGPGISLGIVYIDNLVDRQTIDRQVIEPVMAAKYALADGNRAYEKVREALRTLDVKDERNFDSAMDALLSGDTAVFVDGSEIIAVISSKGFQSRGVPEASSEVTLMGSREAFSEVMRTNTVLIRRRIRDTALKVKQLKAGRRSKTDIAYVYIEDIARPELVSQIEILINSLDIDALADIGVLEQLTEKSWQSPFPQAETTERPDKAAASILEGRAVIIADNSPFALIVPATLNTLCQSPDDYYQRFWIVALTRILRYGAGIIAVILPGFYIAAAVYHPTLLPSALMLRMAEARQNVAFPAVAEVLIMDAAFELLREAGVRMPQAIGGTLGIVGGLIVGQAAVEAGIVSPIVVIVVALTAICSFAIPNNSLVTGYRIIKFVVLILSACLGLLGFWAGILLILIHLASLQSFGMPYLSPFVSGDTPCFSDLKDSFFRFPAKYMKKRPVFAKPGQSKRMG